MEAVFRSPRRIAWGILAELQSKLHASASAITFGRERNPAKELVNFGYSRTVIDYLSSNAIRTDTDYRRALSTVEEPRFWEDVSNFSQAGIVREILRPHGFAEGVSIQLGDTGGILHASFDGRVTGSTKSAIVEFAKECVHVVNDELMASGIRLSPRETSILRMVAEGDTNDDIADHLHISRRTVATHIEHILLKTNARSRAHASAKAVQLGLFDRI